MCERLRFAVLSHGLSLWSIICVVIAGRLFLEYTVGKSGGELRSLVLFFLKREDSHLSLMGGTQSIINCIYAHSHIYIEAHGVR